MHPSFKTILFDLDGTLVKSHEAKLAAFKQTAREFGVQLTSSHALTENLKLNMPPWDIIIRKSNLKRCNPSSEEIRKIYWKNLRQSIPKYVQPYSGILSLLNQVRDCKLKLGIVTSLVKFYAELEMKTADLGDLSCIIAYHDTKRRKPHPEPIHLAIQKLGTYKDHTIYIGDQITDLISGKAAGVKVGAALWGVSVQRRTLLRKQSPDYVFKQPSEIRQILK